MADQQMSPLGFFIFCFSLLVLSSSWSQNEGNIWYFGDFAGIDFNSGTAVGLTNSALTTGEGCATICDNNGNLLFYTDGITVWNSNHLPMPNGNGNLSGNPSSSQSAVIVKKPGSNSIYYVFTVDAQGGAGGFKYSEVDMTLQGGLGDINANVNISILTQSTEKVCAVQQQSGNAYWIVTKLYNSNVYHSYELTAAGLSLTPVVSTTGAMPVTPFSNAIGYLKATLDGSKLASVCWGDGYFELCDFDNSTGIVSNAIYFSLPAAYGAEFSPNSEILYVSSLVGGNVGEGIYQYDLLAGTANDIINSELYIGGAGQSGALQLAPDGKIYEAQSFSSILGTISNPNALGIACTYNPNGFSLPSPTISTLGLPTFHNSATFNQFNFTICVGDSITLIDESLNTAHNWIISDDPNTIISQDSAITVAPTTTTIYQVYDSGDTSSFTVNVDVPINITLGNDTIICPEDSLILSVPNPGLTYSWMDNSTNDSLIAYNSGIYWVDVTSGACTSRDSIVITAESIIATITNLINESCSGSGDGGATIQNISTTSSPATITWKDPDGNVFDSHTVTNGGSSSQSNLSSGIWEIIIESPSGCQWDTTFIISSGSTVNISTNISHPQCFGTSNGSITVFSLTPGTFNFEILNAAGTLLNNNGTNTANSLPSGIYTVSVFDDGGCENETTIILTDPAPLSVGLTTQNPLCHSYTTGNATADTVYNYQGDYDQIFYSWDPNPNGTNGLNITTNNGLGAGEYTLEIVDEIGCSNELTFFITEPNPLIGVVDIPSLTYCRTKGFQKGNGEVTVTTAGLNSSGTGNLLYHWENLENGDESSNTTFIVNEPGWLEVTILDQNLCTYIEQVYVDSLNPIANFELESDEFTGPGQYEGTEDIDLELINTSINFAKPTYLLSDSTFKVTWYNNEPGNENGNWFFKYDYNLTKTDTILTALNDTETNYEVCLVAKNFNDCRDSICKIVTVHPFPELEVPNVFTPGATPNNDFFFPSRGIGEFDCSVFNRYGVEVFHFNSINDKWDGNNLNNNKPCLEGVYFYTYTATATNGTPFEGQGNIHLIRKK